MILRAAAATTLAVVFFASAAGAETKPASAPLVQTLQGDARALYDSARELFKRGDHAAAYAKFRRAFELSHDPRLYWNMAACERKAKHNASVLRLLEAYVDEGHGWLSEDDKREAARAAAAVRAFVAATTVTTTPTDGVEIFVDDVLVATTPINKPLWVDMGVHRVRFAKVGYRSIERTEDIPAGGDLSWSVELERIRDAAENVPPPPPAPPPRESPVPQPTSGPSRAGPLILGGIGLAVAASGGALVIATMNHFSTLRDECGSSCDRSRWEDSRSLQIVGDVLLAAGGAAIAGGVVWWLAQPRAAHENRAWIAPSTGGVVMRGTF